MGQRPLIVTWCYLIFNLCILLRHGVHPPNIFGWYDDVLPCIATVLQFCKTAWSRGAPVLRTVALQVFLQYLKTENDPEAAAQPGSVVPCQRRSWSSPRHLVVDVAWPSTWLRWNVNFIVIVNLIWMGQSWCLKCLILDATLGALIWIWSSAFQWLWISLEPVFWSLVTLLEPVTPTTSLSHFIVFHHFASEILVIAKAILGEHRGRNMPKWHLCYRRSWCMWSMHQLLARRQKSLGPELIRGDGAGESAPDCDISRDGSEEIQLYT